MYNQYLLFVGLIVQQVVRRGALGPIRNRKTGQNFHQNRKTGRKIAQNRKNAENNHQNCKFVIFNPSLLIQKPKYWP